MKCLQCDGQLIEREAEGITVDQCERCGGIWFDAGELERYRASITRKRDSPEIEGSTFVPNRDLPRQDCPRCDLNTVETGSAGLRVLHRCEVCSGFFVSREEVVKFGQTPGGSRLAAAALVAGRLAAKGSLRSVLRWLVGLLA